MPIIEEDKVEREMLKIRETFNVDEMCELSFMLIVTLQKKYHEEIMVLRKKQ